MKQINRVVLSPGAFKVKHFKVICNAPNCLCVNIWGLGLLVDKNRRQI